MSLICDNCSYAKPSVYPISNQRKLNLPAGWALFLSMASCSFLWYVDNGEELRRSWKHRILLALQVACTMGLLWMMTR